MEPATHAAALRDPAHRVSPRARTMWQAQATIQVVVALAVTGAVARFVHDLPWWVYAVVTVVGLADLAVVPVWRFHVHRWEVTDTAVYTQTGWWARERRIAPMSRIQTVDYAEGALARVLGLATVTVTTASAAGALEIAGLERARALALVDELTLKADAEAGDAT